MQCRVSKARHVIAAIAAAVLIMGPAPALAEEGGDRASASVATITVKVDAALRPLVVPVAASAKTAGVQPVVLVSVTTTPADLAVTRTGITGGYLRRSGRSAYVPVAHFACPVGSIPLSLLRRAFSGRPVAWSAFGGPARAVVPVIVGDAAGPDPLALAALGISSAPGVRRVPTAAQAVALAAARPGYIALVPLSDAGVRVRTLSVSGVDGLKLGGLSPYPVAFNTVVERTHAPTAEEKAAAKGRRERLVAALWRRLVAALCRPAPSKRATVVTLGDIMLSRKVLRAMLAAHDWSLPFRRTYPILKAGDITFANLESPFSDGGGYVLSGMSFKAEPPSVAGLKLGGLDVVSLANNHFGNQGRHGMVYTFRHLKANGIKYCGAGSDFGEAHTPAIVERNGVKVAFLSYNEIWPYEYTARGGTPGLAWMESPGRITRDIRAANALADVVIVSYHWGVEYTPHPNARQRSYGRMAIAAGADAVIAQHPHVVQAVEWYKGRFIAYSLGNFVFDQMWSQETREGLIGHVKVVDGRIVGVTLTPTVIENYNQPRLAGGGESRRILNRVWAASGVRRW